MNVAVVLRSAWDWLRGPRLRPLPAFDDPLLQRFDREYEALMLEMARSFPPRRH